MKRIMQNVFEYIHSSGDIKAAVVVGSQVRRNLPADQYSDLDIIIVITHPEHLLDSNDWLKHIAEYHISFIEDTFWGGKERRVMFDNGNDVDFIILNEEQANEIKTPADTAIFMRGFQVIKDEIGISRFLERIDYRENRRLLSEAEFMNLINDFWFHSIWTAKKILRGELLTAKYCLDTYMKRLLLKMVEEYTLLYREGRDVWYNGRFIEKWADQQILEKLRLCYAKYDSEDMIYALYETMCLFQFVSEQAALKESYQSPDDAASQANAIVRRLLNR